MSVQASTTNHTNHTHRGASTLAPAPQIYGPKHGRVWAALTRYAQIRQAHADAIADARRRPQRPTHEELAAMVARMDAAELAEATLVALLDEFAALNEAAEVILHVVDAAWEKGPGEICRQIQREGDAMDDGSIVYRIAKEARRYYTAAGLGPALDKEAQP